MSRWTAKTAEGGVWWAEGRWVATPPAFETSIRERLDAGSCQALPLCPVFDPDDDPERALLAVLIGDHGETVVFEGDAPLDDVVPAVPDDTVA